MSSWLFTGGARSGKSTAAESLALASSAERTTYLATAVVAPNDAEWQQRVAKHQARRPASWQTIETLDIAEHLASMAPDDFVLVDCLTLWLSGTFETLGIWDLEAASSEFEAAMTTLSKRVARLLTNIESCAGDVALVTNEVGSGIVPFEMSTRIFRDELGILNMKVAAVCDRVTLCVAGQQLSIK